jgi:hypothetical protein
MVVKIETRLNILIFLKQAAARQAENSKIPIFILPILGKGSVSRFQLQKGA